jgi:hypothetical protein
VSFPETAGSAATCGTTTILSYSLGSGSIQMAGLSRIAELKCK